MCSPESCSCLPGHYSGLPCHCFFQHRNVFYNQIRLEILRKSCPFRSNSTEARFFAAIVPLLNCIRLLTYGLRLSTDEALVKSVTREGKPEFVLWSLFLILLHSKIKIVFLDMIFGCLQGIAERSSVLCHCAAGQCFGLLAPVSYWDCFVVDDEWWWW